MDQNSLMNSIDDFGPSLTVQADLEDSDINVIVARFNLTGTVPENLKMPSYIEYDGVFDFQTAQHIIRDAQNEFMRMPAGVRARFDNDPGKFLQFVETPGNEAEMKLLGLTVPKKAEESAQVSAKDVTQVTE
ncbi:MAG: internal scaffolding protein [Microvirus sp.]|nr:MAG: internal scaffolding protein [Microvirus sp.]